MSLDYKIDSLRNLSASLADGQKACVSLSGVERAKAVAKAYEDCPDLTPSGPLASALRTLVDMLDSQGRFVRFDMDHTDYLRVKSPGHIRSELTRFLQNYPFFVSFRYTPQNLPGTSWTPEEKADIAELDKAAAIGRMFSDLLTMLGKLARKLRSTFLPRVIQMISDISYINQMSQDAAFDAAPRLVDEFVACWNLVSTEIRLLEPHELLEIWPDAPAEDVEDRLDLADRSGMPADEATAASREHALKVYSRTHAAIMPSPDAPDAPHPIAELKAEVAALADEAEAGKPSHDEPGRSFDYATLSAVLAANLYLLYDDYACADEHGEPRIATLHEKTKEFILKQELVKELERYLNAACALAKRLGSKAYDDLATCQTLLSGCNGEFFGLAGESKVAAKKDLRTFVTCLRRARPILWADSTNYRPPEDPTLTRSDGEAIKRHVTAEADREIAAKAPKRKRKYGHEGNGHKGPKTKFMALQLKAFKAFLCDVRKQKLKDGQPMPRLGTLAGRFWQKHPDYETVKQSKGEARGYQSAASLAQAIRNEKPTKPPISRPATF